LPVLVDLQTLKPTVNDALLSIYIRRAETAIGKYLNNGLDNATIETDYPDAVIQFVLEALNRQGDEGVKQSNVSSVQNTYELGMSESVKALLPLPYAKLMG
jgi:hypothetical protein